METQYAQRILVIGPTGSGKTTTGGLLARLLGWRFVDIDELIVAHAGCSVAAIFAREGETGFRERERAVLAEATADERVVVATGAGISADAENRALLRRSGWVVALAASPETTWERIQAEAEARGIPLAESRPMLASAAPLARLHALHEQRQPWYADADETLVTDGHTPHDVAARLAGSLIARGLLDPQGAEVRSRHVGTAGGAGYEAVVGWGALATLGDQLAALGLPPRLHIVADATVAALYEPALMTHVMRAGFAVDVYRVPSGEASKSREQLDALYDWLAERRAERGEALVALGGGVVGDLAGFAAATYLRGLPLIQVPTSLLAQVDASIGGKVAVDHPRGKNLIGAFYPPRLVLADPAALLTMPPRQRVEGWAEVVKHGVALDAAYFATLEREAEALLRPDPAALTAAIAGSVALKAGVVEGDEREGEGGRRALLNYGHTLGHAIETLTGYTTWLHGEAVAMGMAFAARLGRRAGITPGEVVSRQEALLTRLGLPVRVEGLAASDLLRATLWDKKVRGGRVRWVLPTALGAASLFADITDDDVRATLVEVGAADE